jgi:hypothetical protein
MQTEDTLRDADRETALTKTRMKRNPKSSRSACLEIGSRLFMIIPTRLSTKVANLKLVSIMSRLVDSSKRHLFPGRRHLFGLGANAATFRRHK